LVPCLGSGNESEDWEKGLNGLHGGEGERLYVAETRVSWLGSGGMDGMDELLWVSGWSTTVDVFVGR
jgi:hypothetical protein